MFTSRPSREDTFGRQTARSRHVVQTATLTSARARAFGLERGATYFEIHAHAFSGEGAPVYFQRIYASSSRYALDF